MLSSGSSSSSSSEASLRKVRQVLLGVSTVIAAGTAAATAAAVWQRLRRRRLLQELSDPDLPVSGDKPAISWSEIARHNQLDNAWIVVEGQVYNVTSFLDDHPGGKLLLLAFAGRDASEPFETIGHSALARRELRPLLVGHVSEAPGEMPRQSREARQAALTGGPSSHCLDQSAKLWRVQDRGFLPCRDPVPIDVLRGTPFEVFADLADLVPALGLTGGFRRLLDSSPELQGKLSQCGQEKAIAELSEEQLERAFSIATYCMCAYWRGGTLPYSTGVRGTVAGATDNSMGMSAEEVQRMPAFLSKPILALSQEIGRPPMPDYISTVTYNWTRIDSDGPITPENLRLVLRFTGLEDEEWFFKTHVIIESEAAHVVSAILGALQSDKDEEMLTHMLNLEEALWRVVRACLPIMYDRGEDGVPKCSDHVFYQILRPIIKSGSLMFEGDSTGAPRFLHGPSGAMSSLLPCVDAVLGIQTSSEKLAEAMKRFEFSMPPEHREFLNTLRKGPSIRQRLLLSATDAQDENDRHQALVRCFNRCIARVLDFRWQHWQYVKNFIMKPGSISHATGTGGTSFDYLQQHITDTQNARLSEKTEFIRIATHGVTDWPNSKLPPVSYHPTLAFWSVDGQFGLLSRQPLPASAEIWAENLPKVLHEAVKVLWSLALRMPALRPCEGPFAGMCEGASEKLAPLDDVRILWELSEANREFLMTTLSHIAAGCLNSSGRKSPRCIDSPLQKVAHSVGRMAKLGFTELVLCNWTATATGGGCLCTDGLAAASSTDQPESGGLYQVPPQLCIMWRFLASPDEEWYRGIHILMHYEAREVVSSIRVGQVAMRDQNDLGVVDSMEKVSVWLNRICDYFDLCFEQKDSRTEPISMSRIEACMSHGSRGMTPEEYACWVYLSGSSPVLPILHAYLGVKMCVVDKKADADKLVDTMHNMVQELRSLMPRLHRDFIEELEKPGVSTRQYCLRRFGSRSLAVDMLHNLEVSYNDALNGLVRFLSRRMHLTSRFFPQLVTSFTAVHQHMEAAMRKNRLQLLKMRQHVDRCLEK